MARLASMVRMGYFPLPEPEARRIRQHLVYPTSSFSALDPCAGEGKALAVITEGAQGRQYGIELDAYRAEEATDRLDQVIYGDCFDVECRVESISLLHLNPPYQDAAHDEGRGQRLEELFLQRTYRWLRPGGVLILVIPITRLAVYGNIPSRHFKDTEVYRLTKPSSIQYKQIVVLGVRRTRRERERLQDRDISGLRLEYGRKARSFEALPILSNKTQRLYAVPDGGPIDFVHRGLPLDAIEDSLPQSAAYRQARRILFAPESRERGRPLTPLHAGHVSILACSGALDGIFGEGELRHASRWQAVKTTLRLEEEDDEGVVVIREKEQFSHYLNLLYSDGETAILTAEAPAGDRDTTEQEAASYSNVPIENRRTVGRKFRIEEAEGEECS